MSATARTAADVRVLIVGSANEWRMERAVERALRRAGHTTLLLDDRRLRRAIGRGLTQKWVASRARRFDAEFVFLSKCLALDLETVAEITRGRDNAMWYHDPQWHGDLDEPGIAHIAAVGRIAHTFFITGFESEWRANGLNALFLPAAGDASITPVAPDPRYESDVAFIGTGYDPRRAEVLLEVARHFGVRVWGLGWEPWRDRLTWSGRPVEGREFSRVCSSARVTLGINPARAKTSSSESVYTSDRTWMVVLAGAFLVGERSPGLETLIAPGHHCELFGSTDECLEIVARYLRDATRRERVRRDGEAFVRRFHTYDARIPFLLERKPYVSPLTA